MRGQKAPIDWLLSGEPWIEYRTRRDLLGEPEGNAKVKAARKAMLAAPEVQRLVKELSGWPGKVISSHKSAGQPFHKVTFLADLGVTSGDPGVQVIVERMLQHVSDEGPVQLPMNIPSHYGGSGSEKWAWALCDAPLSLYALLKFGEGHRPVVKAAVMHLAGLVRDNGWPCAVSKELGGWRGPGRKDDPCPFASLAMLKALSQAEALRDGPACRSGAETLLVLWEESHARHPYMFFMGTDFRKLKVPFVWYDLMHVLEVLSLFPWIRKDARLRTMVELLTSKADAQGCFSLESIWTAWKDWEFGQKSAPSRWLTLAAWRVIHRMEQVAQGRR